jgi:hypothetical protein
VKTLQAGTLTAIAQNAVALAQLVKMDLEIPWYVNTTSWDITYNGNTYLGVASAAGRIDVIDEAPGEIKGLRFELPAIRSEDIASALAAPVQGKTVTIYTAIFSTTTYQALEASVDWSGRLDTMSIVEAEKASLIQVTAEHIGIDLLRPSGLLYSNQDQQRLYPGDKSWEFVIDQSEQSIVFPAASYFKK